MAQTRQLDKDGSLGKAALVSDSIALCPHVSIESDGVDEPDTGFVASHWCGDCGLVFEDVDGELIATDEVVEVKGA